jgi:hypothetical protein
VEPEERAALIARYRDGARAIAEAVASLSLTELDRHAGQEWSAREVVHHVADAELVESARLRRILVEENPVLPWVDEEEDARRLHYDRPVETSVALFQSLVVANADLVQALSPEEWLRYGTHTVDGRYTVEDSLRKMSSHAHDHVAQMLRAAGRDVI